MDPNNGQTPTVPKNTFLPEEELQEIKSEIPVATSQTENGIETSSENTTPIQTSDVSTPPSQNVVPPASKGSPLLVISLALVVVALLVAIAYVVGMKYFSSKSGAVACTTEAKMCEDGTSVGRSGPNCEFDACPEVLATPEASPSESNLSLNSYTSSMYKYTFQYPQNWKIASSKPLFIGVPGEVALIPPNEETPVGVQAQVDVVTSASKTQRYGFYTDADFQSWLSRPIDVNLNQTLYKIGNTTIDGNKAVQLVQQTLPQSAAEPYYSVVTWFRKGYDNYYIESGGISASKVQSYSAVYNQILSSFKFGSPESSGLYMSTPSAFPKKY